MDQSCKYMLALPGGKWEYGYQDLDTRKKVKQGVADTPEIAMKLTGMTPMKGAVECSGNSSQALYARPSHYRDQYQR